MLRFVSVIAAIGLVSTSAEAARLIHPTAATAKIEKGVRVVRGAPSADAASAPAARAIVACAARPVVNIEIAGWPARRLRTHGFWSGTAPSPLSFGVMTTGFYADRIAAGL